MKITITPFVIVAFMIATMCTTTVAQTSATGEFSLQGHLTTTAGAAIADGAHSITANIYTTSNGQVVFTETNTVNTVDGIFSVMIGTSGTDSFHATAGTNYQIGISLDGGAELSPKIDLGSAVNALTADLAANANAVGGFTVSTSANPLPNTLLALNGNGEISTSVLDSAVVTSINGLSGALNIQTSGGITANTSGNVLNLSFTGSDSGGAAFSLPFAQTVNLGTTALSLTNTLSGTVANFINTGSGSALNLTAGAGSALTATTNSSANAAFDITNNSGMAIDAAANTSAGAVLKLQNTSSAATAQLINGVNSAGNAVLNVLSNGQTTINSSAANVLNVTTSAANGTLMRLQNTASTTNAELISAANSAGTVVLDVLANGQTSINSTVGNALNVTTSLAGEAAININGGIKVSGPAGTGQITAGNLTTTINNAFVKANSIIIITSTGPVAFPLSIASQGSGSFVVSVVSGITSLLTNASFNYLVINQ